jgi:hypothetical protein
MADEIITYPVAGWEIKTIPSHGAVLLQLSFLSHPFQKPEEADPGRNYALMMAQAAELRDALDRAVQNLRSASPPKPEGPQH